MSVNQVRNEGYYRFFDFDGFFDFDDFMNDLSSGVIFNRICDDIWETLSQSDITYGEDSVIVEKTRFFYEVLEDITHNNKRLLDLWELESKNFDFIGINC